MPAINLMLDSGAFPARDKGIKLDRGPYVEFVKKHEPSLWTCSIC
jgi:hypothetical protein